MNVLLALLLDCLAQMFFHGAYTWFLPIALLQLLVKPHEELVDVFNLSWLSAGFLCLCALDIVKYGRVGISLGIMIGVFLLFRALRHYFLSSPTQLLVILTIIAALVDVFLVRQVFLGLDASMPMTIKEFFGIVATITLALLGVRGSRFGLFLKSKSERKVWTPNRKNAL